MITHHAELGGLYYRSRRSCTGWSSGGRGLAAQGWAIREEDKDILTAVLGRVGVLAHLALQPGVRERGGGGEGPSASWAGQ